MNFKRPAPTVVEISLSLCRFDKARKQLAVGSSMVCSRRFPDVVKVRSHITGVVVEFVPIGEHHPLFDQDGWDGEQCIYAPVGSVKNVSSLVVYHGE